MVRDLSAVALGDARAHRVFAPEFVQRLLFHEVEPVAQCDALDGGEVGHGLGCSVVVGEEEGEESVVVTACPVGGICRGNCTAT